KNDTVTPEKPDQVFYALSDNNQLLQFNAKSATSAASTIAITGLQPGEKVLSIDFRPATGQLYGVGNSSRIYVINQATGVARAIGAAAFTPAISGTMATIDFNPTVDRIRLVTNTGQNLRLNPETGTVAATDGGINGVTNAIITEVAYTNSTAGASATTLYDIDITTDKLYKQDPPNDGKLIEVGSLNVDVAGMSGFDIGPNNTALAALTVNGTSGLYAVNLDNGSTTFYNAFPTGLTITGLAIPTATVAYAADADNNLLIFNPAIAAPQLISKPITGVQAGEKIVGIDMRPATGQLYGLGSTGRLYTFNLSSGLATMVGLAPIIITGTDFGFDFNPTVDRIRIVSNTGLNLRVNPNDGLITATDMPLNPGTPSITAAAYTNNFAGAATTVLYDIDTNTDQLFRQEPPNNGTLISVGALGINATSANGFDIGSTSGTAYAILTVGSSAGIYTVNLQTGVVAKTADFPKSVQAMSLGLGF
ncbi:MAG TPA: DUF4394 domain-containing protein, partial [Segetibacter sp.]